jgi:3-methyl-2-oxobutanoate hydroxymethyltransferase
MSLGSGPNCDTQFLFSDDILGDYDERIPRHAKAYRDFLSEKKRLQEERINAFGEYIKDVKDGCFPEKANLIDINDNLLEESIKEIESID